MPRLLPLLVLVVLAPAVSSAEDKRAQEMRELQEDACYQWEHVHGPYLVAQDRDGANFLKQSLKDGTRKGYLALHWDPERIRLQQLCERYHDRFHSWPERCCLAAEVMDGALDPKELEAGRKMRADNIARETSQIEERRRQSIETHP